MIRICFNIFPLSFTFFYLIVTHFFIPCLAFPFFRSCTVIFFWGCKIASHTDAAVLYFSHHLKCLFAWNIFVLAVNSGITVRITAKFSWRDNTKIKRLKFVDIMKKRHLRCRVACPNMYLMTGILLLTALVT
jgi:hypothetical protein